LPKGSFHRLDETLVGIQNSNALNIVGTNHWNYLQNG